jgi:hypothetical protein
MVEKIGDFLFGTKVGAIIYWVVVLFVLALAFEF